MSLKTKFEGARTALHKSKIGAALEVINTPGTSFGGGIDALTHIGQINQAGKWSWAELSTGW